MINKIILSILVLTTLISCSSSDSTADNNTGTPTETTATMTTKIDGTVYDTPPQNGGNTADATGGTYGNTYFLLKGYLNLGSGKNKIGNKNYDIKVLVPKSDLSVGTHTFTSSIVAGNYYADFDINNAAPPEVANTISGSLTITSYDTTTKILKGNFNFTTNNGVNLTSISHTLVGSFRFVLP